MGAVALRHNRKQKGDILFLQCISFCHLRKLNGFRAPKPRFFCQYIVFCLLLPLAYSRRTLVRLRRAIGKFCSECVRPQGPVSLRIGCFRDFCYVFLVFPCFAWILNETAPSLNAPHCVQKQHNRKSYLYNFMLTSPARRCTAPPSVASLNAPSSSMASAIPTISRSPSIARTCRPITTERRRYSSRKLPS